MAELWLYGKLWWGTCRHSGRMEVMVRNNSFSALWDEWAVSGDPGLVMAAREEVDIYIGEEHVPLLPPPQWVSKQESYETPATETTWSTNSRIRLGVAHPWCPGENTERQMFFSSMWAWGDPILGRKGLHHWAPVQSLEPATQWHDCHRETAQSWWVCIQKKLSRNLCTSKAEV